MIKAIIFDWGGTCTPGSIAKNFSQLLAAMTIVSERRISLVFDRNGKAYLLGKMSGKEFWKRFAKETGIEENPDFFISLFHESGKANPRILSIVRKLSLKYKTALLSDNYKELADHIVRIYRLRELFDVLTFSNREGVKKPNKEIYLRTLKRLGVTPEQAIFIDDKLANVKGARDIGIKGILFTSEKKLKSSLTKWGIKGIL